MTTPPAATADPTMVAITAAVSAGRDGDVGSARRELLGIWERVGVTGDPFHRCTLAHYLADLYDDPAESIVWDIRALDAADALTDQRAQRHDAGLQVAGFYPSLYLNLADGFRRLAAFRVAADYVREAEKRTSALPEGSYGDMIVAAVQEVTDAIQARDTTRRTSAPGSTA